MLNLKLKNAWVVAKREYLERVRTRAFLIFTLLTPAIFIAWGVLPTLLIRGGKQPTPHLVLAATPMSLAEAVRERMLEASQEQAEPLSGAGKTAQLSSSSKMQLDVSDDLTDEHRRTLENQLESGALDGFVWLSPEALKKHQIEYVSRNRNEMDTTKTIRDSVRAAVVSSELRSRGFTEAQIEELQKTFEVEALQWAKGHASKSDQMVQFFTVFILGLAMYMTVMVYGANVMRSVLAEKTSRVMEVLMSALNPSELMAGKLVGVGAVGLTQVAIWLVMGLLVSAPGSSMLADQIRKANISAATGLYFAVFFLLGYFIYSAMSAALGAMVSSEQEAQQFNIFIMLPLILSFFYMLRAITAPGDPVVVALSFFPLSSPLIMFTRIVVQSPPAWQIWLSIALLLFGIVAVIWVCARIYRTGLLMYGKRPTLPEIIRWVRYA